MTASSATHAACVLVVDDEEDMRETLREVVEMAGCSAILAANGEEGMKVLAEQRPCLVILDLVMPVMSGAEMIEAMKKEPALATLPVVISTSAPGRAPAGVPVLPKPVSLAALWDWIGKTCQCSIGSHAVAGRK